MIEYARLLNSVGAIVTAALGVMALLNPSAAASFTGITPQGKVGVSEIRATYGGLFAAMGAAALAVQQPMAFAAVGWAWGGAAAGRLLSVVVDDSRSPRNLGAVVFEATLALLLLVG